jgi:4-hydroxy-tetrahydrodipicolinate synthase
MLTPFHEDGAVDFDSLPGYVEHYVGAGLDVLAFSPMVSSLCVLSAEETLRLAVETKGIAGDRAIVLGSTRGDSPGETFDLLRGLDAGGLDGVFVFPGYFGPKPDVYARMLRACCEVTAMPLFGFQVSVEFDRRFGGLPWMRLEDWQRVAEHAQIVGLKDDTGNLDGRLAMVERFGDRFVIVGPGMPDRYLEVHRLPGQAELTSIGDLDAAAERRFHDALDAGDERGARAIMGRALECLRRADEAASCGWGIETIQAIAHLRGLFASPAMRSPLPTPSKTQIEAVRRLIDEYDAGWP